MLQWLWTYSTVGFFKCRLGRLTYWQSTIVYSVFVEGIIVSSSKNNVLHHGLVLSQNIMRWQIWHLSWSGSMISYQNLVSPYILVWDCIVIIKLSFTHQKSCISRAKKHIKVDIWCARSGKRVKSSKLDKCHQFINWQKCSRSLMELILFVTSWACTMYMLQLIGECIIRSHYVTRSHYVIGVNM